MKRIIFLMLGWGLCLIVQAQTTNFSKLYFGCDGSSTTSGNQWSKTVVDLLGFASHHNVAVGSSTFACHPDTQDYNSDNFAGISDGWKPTKDKKELQMRHNNVSKVHIQKFISEVKDGVYPAPDVFVFAMGSNDTKLDGVAEALSARTLDDVNVTTMAGGARWAIQTILENFPECRVFVWLPIQTGDKAKNEMHRKRNEVLRQVSQALSVQVIDCYGESGISQFFENSNTRGRYLKDGVHPDIEGQRLIGRYIAKEIRNNFF